MNKDKANQLFLGMIACKMWNFDENLATISYPEYLQIINTINPQNYEIAYDVGEINYIEKGLIDYDPHNRAECIRRERTWTWQGAQAFELSITTIPPLILVGKIKEQPTTLTTTFWVDTKGTVVAYRQIINQTILEDENWIQHED